MKDTNISALSIAPAGNGPVGRVKKSKPQGAEFHVNGRLTVADPQTRLIGASRRPAEFRIAGRLVNSSTGYSLAGLNVKMLMTLPGDGGAQGRECLLGDAVSDAEGRFTITFAETSLARQQLCLLQSCRETTYYLKVESPAGKSYYTSSPMRGRTPEGFTVKVPLPATPVTRENWNALSKRLEQGRVAQLHSVTEQLVSVPAAHSLIGDWDLELRHSVAAELEQAFADPDGALRELGPLPTFHMLRQPGAFAAYVEALSEKTRAPRAAKALSSLQAKIGSFDDLLHVDWVIDITALADAQIGKAVSKFEDLYQDIEAADYTNDLPVTSSSPLVKYRDYLRTIFTGAPNAASYTPQKQKLEQRFRQNFGAANVAEQPANQILIPIVKAILTAPTGAGYGFGMSQASIPAQGQKSHREYLNQLIALTQLTAGEMGLRYRLNLERPDSAMSSAVAENIATLQGFYRDGFHSTADPYPIIPSQLQGLAPFFLQYDEWVERNKVFYPENFYQITQSFRSHVTDEAKDGVRTRDEWMAAVIDIETKMNEGHRSFSMGQYVSARDEYQTAYEMAFAALQYHHEQSEWSEDTQALPSLAQTRKNRLIQNEDQLSQFTSGGEDWSFEMDDPIDPYDGFNSWFEPNRRYILRDLIQLVARVIPVCLGDVALAMGDYPAAVRHYSITTRFLVLRANAKDQEGYKFSPTVNTTLEPSPYNHLYTEGALPYSVDRSVSDYEKPAAYNDPLMRLGSADSEWGGPARTMVPTMERNFLRLRHGAALLEWADALYRTNEPANIARARELYKAVTFIHSGKPPINPHWPNGTNPNYKPHSQNPAVVSQRKRASRGFQQIELSLNYYGVRPDFLPALRYRPLKDAADRLAASARAAQQDFLAYMSRIEDAIRDGLINANALKKAMLQGKIANEQAKIAQYDVMVAKQQVEQVEAAIAAKKAEIAEHDEFWTQLGDFVSGFKDTITGIPGFDSVKDSAMVGVGLSSASGGASGASAATSGLAVAAAPMAAYGMFVYAGITTLVSMNDARNQRVAELNALEDKALPMAKANLAARQSEVAIANLQKQIAEADAELAAALIKFQANRTLNVEFWASLVTVVRRTMRRYLELGGRFAWLAERALEYEQDRAIDIVRFDYHPTKLQGVTGADLLQLDLAELEAARLDGIKNTIPVKHTYSMVADFPLQFAQLKNTGRCSFQTTELPFRYAYPGTYGYRVIAVSVAVKGVTDVVPARGLLRNQGVSLMSRASGESHISVRFPDAFPLSEFRLREDRAIYNLPDEALMSFEGSGVDTFWELAFPALANPYGLDMIADIQLTFDVRASYSPSLYEQHLAAAPTTVNRFSLFSAYKFSPASLAALQETDPNAPNVVDLVFDLAQAGLSQQEENRTVKNLVLFFASETPLTLSATFGPQGGSGVTVPFTNSMALSSGPPWDNSQTPPPATVLNQFIGSPVEQGWVLTVDKSAAPAIDFSQVSDVVLGVEYSADLA